MQKISFGNSIHNCFACATRPWMFAMLGVKVMPICGTTICSSNVDAAFVLEKLLLAMAEYGGAKDLIAKVDRARKGKNS